MLTVPKCFDAATQEGIDSVNAKRGGHMVHMEVVPILRLRLLSGRCRLIMLNHQPISHRSHQLSCATNVRRRRIHRPSDNDRRSHPRSVTYPHRRSVTDPHCSLITDLHHRPITDLHHRSITGPHRPTPRQRFHRRSKIDPGITFRFLDIFSYILR
jgi:hypothetical protein